MIKILKNGSHVSYFSRQVNDGVWKKPDDLSSKHSNDLRKFSDFDIPTSPPLTINDLAGSNSLSNWSPHSSLSRGLSHPSGPQKDNHPPVPHKGKALEELERRSAADKVLSMEVRLVRPISSPLKFIWPFSGSPFIIKETVKYLDALLRQQSGTGRRSGPVLHSTVPRTSTVCWRRHRLS